MRAGGITCTADIHTADHISDRRRFVIALHRSGAVAERDTAVSAFCLSSRLSHVTQTTDMSRNSYEIGVDRGFCFFSVA